MIIKIKNIFVFLIFIRTGAALHCAAQNPTIDSLKALLGKEKVDTNRVNLLNDLCWKLKNTGNYTPATNYVRQALELAQKIGFKKGEANAYNNIGNICADQSDYPKALEYYFKSLKIKEAIGDKQGAASSYSNIGIIYADQSDYPKALEYYFKALKIREAIGDKQGMSKSYGNIGNIYSAQSDYSKALEYHFKSLKIKEAIAVEHPNDFGNKRSMAISYGNIGTIYSEQSDEPKALEYFFKSLKIQESIGDKQGMSYSYIGIGSIYKNQSDYPKALEYYFKSLKICEVSGDKKIMAYSYNNIGIIYTDMYEKNLNGTASFTLNNERQILATALLDSAIVLYKKALAVNKELSDERGMTYGLYGLGNVLMKQRKYAEAIPFFQKAYVLADTIGALKEKADAAQKLYETNKKLNNFSDALAWHEKYLALKDSIFNEETDKKSVQAEMKFEFEKKEQVAKLEQEKKEAVHKAELEKEQMQRYWLYGGLTVVLCFSGLLFNRFRITNKQKRIIEMQKEKVDEAYEKLAYKNKEVMDSIYYARRIQSSLLPSDKYIDKVIIHLKKAHDRTITTRK